MKLTFISCELQWEFVNITFYIAPEFSGTWTCDSESHGDLAKDAWCFCGMSKLSEFNNLKRLLKLLEDGILSHKNLLQTVTLCHCSPEQKGQVFMSVWMKQFFSLSYSVFIPRSTNRENFIAIVILTLKAESNATVSTIP